MSVAKVYCIKCKGNHEVGSGNHLNCFAGGQDPGVSPALALDDLPDLIDDEDEIEEDENVSALDPGLEQSIRSAVSRALSMARHPTVYRGGDLPTQEESCRRVIAAFQNAFGTENGLREASHGLQQRIAPVGNDRIRQRVLNTVGTLMYRASEDSPEALSEVVDELSQGSHYAVNSPIRSAQDAEGFVAAVALRTLERSQRTRLAAGTSPDRFSFLADDNGVMVRGDDLDSGDFYDVAVVTSAPVENEEEFDRAAAIVSYAARAELRGENLGVSASGPQIIHQSHDSTKGNTSRWHGDDFEEKVAKYLREGTPVRKRDNQRAVEGVFDDVQVSVFYR